MRDEEVQGECVTRRHDRGAGEVRVFEAQQLKSGVRPVRDDEPGTEGGQEEAVDRATGFNVAPS